MITQYHPVSPRLWDLRHMGESRASVKRRLTLGLVWEVQPGHISETLTRGQESPIREVKISQKYRRPTSSGNMVDSIPLSHISGSNLGCALFLVASSNGRRPAAREREGAGRSRNGIEESREGARGSRGEQTHETGFSAGVKWHLLRTHR